MSVYLRELNSDILRLNQRLRVTNFVPDGLLEIIENNVPENNYVLGVKYQSGECQICISGHIKENECLSEGCQRELMEELFLKPKQDINMVGRNKNNNFFCAPLKDTFICKSYQENNNKDLKERAVICVHGNEFEILRYLSKIKTQEKNNDFIDGIWAGKKNKVVAIIKKIKRNNGRYFIY
jgi:hypothetical protein